MIQNQLDQQIPESKEGNNMKFTSIMFGGILLIAIPLYSMLLGRMLSKTSSTLPSSSLQAAVQPTIIPTPIPTIAPIAIAHKQDIDAALKLIDGTDTADVEKQLDQINTSASSLSQ